MFLNIIFIIVLLLNLTGLFAFLAPLFNVNISTISVVLLSLNCFYIICNFKDTGVLFRKKHIFYWFAFLIIFPLVTSTYAPQFSIRQIGLQIYYFTLLIAVSLYVLRNGFKRFHQMIAVSIIISGFGLVLSLFREDIFLQVALVSQNNLNFDGRAYGFFIQPNLAAMNLIMLFILWFAGLNKTKFINVCGSFSLLFLFISLTGSRAGFILSMILMFLVLSIKFKKPFRVLINPKYVASILLSFGCFLALIPLILSFMAPYLPKHKGSFNIVSRIEAFSKMNLAQKDSKGISTVASRWEVNKYYFDMVTRKPIFGNGFDSATILYEKGILIRSSHNQYLQILFETGILGLILYLLLVIRMYIDPRRKKSELLLQTSSYKQFFIFIILQGMFTNMLLDSRVLYCALGCLVVMLIYPEIINTDTAAPKLIQVEQESLS